MATVMVMSGFSFPAVCAAVLAAAGAMPAPPAPDLAALVGEPLTEVRHWSEVPAGVRRVLERHWEEPGIADPGERFQEYDYPTPGNHARRRLVLAAKASQAWLVCYEVGGTESSFRLAVVPAAADRAPGEPAWFGIIVASTAQEVKDLASLRVAIREHRTWEAKPPYV